MPAAALHNLVSDLLGLGEREGGRERRRERERERFSLYCCSFSLFVPRSKFCMHTHTCMHARAHTQSPSLSPQGQCTGITIGCLIGMLPLFWFNSDHTDCSKQVEEEEEEDNSSRPLSNDIIQSGARLI